ncbi:hypothetical protein GCM10007079_13870 [Nocardiopsis terrae]|nr:hypothetical protein GCM10007079_13870 [Nocardiopsis terrae]
MVPLSVPFPVARRTPGGLQAVPRTQGHNLTSPRLREESPTPVRYRSDGRLEPYIDVDFH